MTHRIRSKLFIIVLVTAGCVLIFSGCCGLKCTGGGNAFMKSSVIIVDEPSPDNEVVVTEEAVAEPAPVEQETAVLEESIVMAEEAPATVETASESQHVVKRGECLWWIAEFEDIYNDPFLWPLIYDANKDKIKNPNLIYPGQVLTIPRTGFTKIQIDEARKAAGKTRPYVTPSDSKLQTQ
jgi:LysM repeat protein